MQRSATEARRRGRAGPRMRRTRASSVMRVNARGRAGRACGRRPGPPSRRGSRGRSAGRCRGTRRASAAARRSRQRRASTSPRAVASASICLRALDASARSRSSLFGEVEVEGAVRGAGHANDVVDPRRVEAVLGEHLHARRRAAWPSSASLRAQLALARRACPACERARRSAHGSMPPCRSTPRRRDALDAPGERPPRPPSVSQIVPPTSRRPAGPDYPDLDRIADEVAVGLAHAASEKVMSSRWCCPRARVPHRVHRRRQVGAITAGRERPARRRRTRRRARHARPALVLAAPELAPAADVPTMPSSRVVRGRRAARAAVRGDAR